MLTELRRGYSVVTAVYTRKWMHICLNSPGHLRIVEDDGLDKLVTENLVIQ